MVRGTTPTHIFKLPFETSLLSAVEITYAQDDQVVLTKTAADCVLDGSSVSTTLTQEDTFKFDSSVAVQVQLRVLTVGGAALSSPVYRVSADKCLSTEVLS